MTAATDRAAARHAAGVAASAADQPATAVRRLRAALRDAGTAGELRGRILVSLAWAEAERGRVDTGFRLLDEAEALLPADQRGVLFGQRALLLRRTGQDDLALPQYDAAIALLTEQSAPLDLAKALSNRALLHLAAGRTGQARTDLRRSAQLAARHGLDLPAAVANNNLGDLDLLTGDIPAALATYGAVARVYERLAPGKLAGLAIDRARALLGAGLFAEADRELAVAWERARAQRLSHIAADALLARAEAALLAGRPAAARAWAARARTGFLRRHNPRRAALAALLALRAHHATVTAPRALAGQARALAGTLHGLGLVEDARLAALIAARALAARGRPAEAERELTRYGRPRAIDRLDTKLMWRLATAEVAAAGGRRGQASRQLLTGMAALARYRGQLGCLDLQTGATVHGRDIAAAGLGAALARGSPAEIFRWSELARAQALLLPPVRPPDDPAAAAALAELRRVRGALREAELAGRPAGSLRARAEALQRRIREHAWSAAGPGTGGRTASLAAVRAELGDAAMISYLRHGEALRALVATAGSVSLVPLGRFADAEEAVLRLRADLDAQAGRAMPARLAEAVAAATRRDAAALAGIVLDPVLDLVGDRDLVVVPTGVLVTVPWATLPGCDGRPVTVAPSATTWYAGRLRRPPAGDRVPALLVAGPGNDRGDAEVRAIAAIRPHATVLTGPAATPEATLRRLDGAGVAHLAAHGHHATDNALFSTLDLTGGPLMGYDLQRVGTVPPVVVLSCCDLGLNDVRPGDETLGMATALLSAGSATVVASVSRVADATAMAVMTGFHGAVGQGRPAAAALAGAAAAAPPAGFVCFGAG